VGRRSVAFASLQPGYAAIQSAPQLTELVSMTALANKSEYWGNNSWYWRQHVERCRKRAELARQRAKDAPHFLSQQRILKLVNRYDKMANLAEERVNAWQRDNIL